MRTKFSKKQLLIFAAAFAVVGGLLVWRIFAATASSSYEAEAASIAGNAKVCPSSTNDTSASNNKYVVLASSTCPGDTPPPPPPSGSCLTNAGSNRYAVTTANGFKDNPGESLTSRIYEDTHVPNNRKYDATGTTWHYNALTDASKSAYGISLWEGSDVCWSGGRIIHTKPDNSTSNWEVWKRVNGFRFGGMKNLRVENLYIANFGDILNISDGSSEQKSDDVTIEDSLIRHSHDDCIQNDKFATAYLKDSLLDGCYSGISARMSSSDLSAGKVNGSSDTFYVQDSMIWMEPMTPVYKGTSPGHGGWFKWENEDLSRGMKLSLDNVTLMARQNANHQSLGNEAGNLLTHCNNVTILWAGDGDFPGRSSWQSAGCTNLKIVNKSDGAQAQWISKVNAWYAAHTQFADLKHPDSYYWTGK